MQRAAPGLPASVRACLFDLDGVLTKTAKLHAAAWKQVFDPLVKVPFDPVVDYDRYVDGKPREDGVRSFLASRGIDVTDAEVADIAKRKNAIILALYRERGVETYAGSVRYVRAIRERGLKSAVVSSSRNCRQVLAVAGIEPLFDARVDGVTAAEQHLAGKPAPDTYLAAARALGVEASRCAVFEDALAGVEAGRAGHFGAVVGVDRRGQARELRTHGADVVVADLAELLGA